MNTVQVSFRLPQDVYDKFSAKVKESGISKQFVYESSIDKFLKDELFIDVATKDIKDDINEVVKDYLPELAKLVVNNPEFMSLVADKVRAFDKVKDEEAMKVITPDIIEKKKNLYDDDSKLSDEQLAVIENLKQLPLPLTQSQVENVLGIPSTYLSKFKDNPEKLARWQFFLKDLPRMSDGKYYNRYSNDATNRGN